MTLGYRAGVALTSLVLLAAPAWAAKSAPAHVRPRAERAAIDLAPSSLYSKRALRRARAILQLELLELREERLERVRRAIERQLPAGCLLQSGPCERRGPLQD